MIIVDFKIAKLCLLYFGSVIQEEILKIGCWKMFWKFLFEDLQGMQVLWETVSTMAQKSFVEKSFWF